MALLIHSLIWVGAILLLISAFLVRHYASAQTSLSIQSLVTISFALGFSGTTLLPIDLSFTIPIDDDQDGDDGANNNVSNATSLPWHILFWSTFLLAWFILPLVREMLLSGHFETKRRLKDGMRKMLLGQLILLTVVFIFIIALAIHLRSIKVITVLVTLGNTYGLLIVSLLLGYGLVALPRSLWRQAKPEVELRRAQIMAGAADEALFDAVWTLQDCEHAIDAILARIDQSNGANIPSDDVYFKYCVDELRRRKREAAELSPELDRRRIESRNRSRVPDVESGADAADEDGDIEPTLKGLVRLNGQLRRAQERLHNAEQRWEALVERSKFLVDISIGTAPNVIPDSQLLTVCLNLRYLYMKYLRSSAFRILAVSTGIISLAILLSEANLALHASLTPFAAVLSLFDHDGEKGLLFQTAALVPLVYMSVCVYSSLFKLSAFGPFCLRGNRQSGGVALAFNAQLLVRLQFPLAYNFLLMLQYDRSSSTAFKEFMGVMALVPIFGTSFLVYVPLLILGLCCITLLNVYPRLLAILGFQHEDAILVGDAEELDAKVSEGIRLLRKHVEGIESVGNDIVLRNSIV